jgi:hypothetical protein
MALPPRIAPMFFRPHSDVHKQQHHNTTITRTELRQIPTSRITLAFIRSSFQDGAFKRPSHPASHGKRQRPPRRQRGTESSPCGCGWSSSTSQRPGYHGQAESGNRCGGDECESGEQNDIHSWSGRSCGTHPWPGRCCGT